MKSFCFKLQFIFFFILLSFYFSFSISISKIDEFLRRFIFFGILSFLSPIDGFELLLLYNREY